MDISIELRGAIGDGLTLNSSVIQGAIDEVSASGGGRVTVPKGTYLSGSLQIKSGVELYLAEGAVLLASSDYGDYSPAHSIVAITEGSVDEYVLPQRAAPSLHPSLNQWNDWVKRPAWKEVLGQFRSRAWGKLLPHKVYAFWGMG